MLLHNPLQRRFKLLILLPIALLLSLIILFTPYRLEILDRASKFSSGITGSPAIPSSPATSDPASGGESEPESEPESDPKPKPELVPEPKPSAPESPPQEPPQLGLPSEYDLTPARGELCAQRFSQDYLEEFRTHSISYCSPESKSEITCFHNRQRSDGATDSMCFGQGVNFDIEAGKFSVDCAVRDPTPEEKNQGLIRFQDIRPYWYETGPPPIFSAGVNFHAPAQGARSDEEFSRSRSITSRGLEERDDEGEPVSPVAVAADLYSSPPRNFFLVKREGEENVYHCMMEIFSAWMTFDVLRMSSSHGSSSPLFQVPEDVADTQTIILDDRADGPYFDLWTLFAGRKPVRLHELAKDTATIEAIHDANIIVPLAGSSNPLWQDDWEAADCASMPTVHVFAQRVLDFYDVRDPEPRKPEDPIVVTFIDRTGSRKLLDNEALFEEFKERNPRVAFQSVDFATISFAEQLRIVRSTDVLVGVHGAGLTHALFMRENAGAVVEIQPKQLEVFHPFRNIALLGGLGYYRTHAESVPKPGKRGIHRRDEWHWDDVRIEKERLFEVIETAVKSLYVNGVWDYDVN